jgi:phage terminase large subunit
VNAAQQQIVIWRENPAAFVYDNFKTDPDKWQLKVLDAFASTDPGKNRISLQACAGPGKSAALAWCGWNFMSCYGEAGEHPKGAVTSITGDNLKANLWAEYSKWQQRSEYLKRAFTWNQESIFANDHPSTWRLEAKTWPKTASPEEQGKTLSGLHSKYVLSQIDESGAIPVTVLRAAEQSLSNCWFGKIMQAGNPLTLDGMLYAAASILRHQWFIVRVTGDPDDPDAWVHSARFDDRPVDKHPATWAREQIRLYGRDNPWVMAYVLGQFPMASLNALLGVEEVEAAMKRYLPPAAYQFQQKRLGIDVARYGDDRTVIFPRQGLAAFQPHVMRHGRGDPVSVEIADAVMGAYNNWGTEAEFLDATGGWAAGVYDILISNGRAPMNVQFSGKAHEDGRYWNRRAEIYFRGAAAIKRGMALPPIPELVGELTAATYSFKAGKFILTEKDQVKSILGRSPDLADALMTTFGMVELPSGLVAGQSQPGHALTDFDPWRDEALN